MKETGYVGALIFISLLFDSCAGTRAVDGQANAAAINKGVWQYSPLTIDGNDSDWTAPLLFSDKTNAVDYSITNDESNIYLVMKTAE